MKKTPLLSAAAFTAMIAVASAQPIQLTAAQMDQVTSGGSFEGLFDIFEGVRDLSRGNFEGLRDVFEGLGDLSHRR